MNKKRCLIGLVLLGILMQFLCVGGMIVPLMMASRIARRSF